MGIFDNYLEDMQKEFRRVTDGIDAMQNSAQKVVGAIDDLEEKVTHLPTEKELKKKLKNKVKLATEKATDRSKPAKKQGKALK